MEKKNKYIEKCSKCPLTIPVGEGEFVESEGKFKIRHISCVISRTGITPIIPNKLSEEVVKELQLNRLIFYKFLNKKISCRLNRSPRITYSWVPEVFLDAFDRFWDKYRTYDLDYESAKKILFRVCDIQTLIFIEKKIDEEWWNGLPKEAKGSGLKPPSFFYHKKFFEDNRERINNRRRENYQTNPKLKMQRKAKYQRNKVKKIEFTTEQLRSVWMKSTYVKTLADTHKKELQSSR